MERFVVFMEQRGFLRKNEQKDVSQPMPGTSTGSKTKRAESTGTSNSTMKRKQNDTGSSKSQVMPPLQSSGSELMIYNRGVALSIPDRTEETQMLTSSDEFNNNTSNELMNAELQNNVDNFASCSFAVEGVTERTGRYNQYRDGDMGQTGKRLRWLLSQRHLKIRQ